MSNLDRVIATSHLKGKPHPIRPEDKGLPQHLRRCLVSEHEGDIILNIGDFPTNPSCKKGRGYQCSVCNNRKRRGYRADFRRSGSGHRADYDALRESFRQGYYEVVFDPQYLFKGRFRKLDFAISFDGEIWMPQTLIVDEKGNKYTVTKDGLLREDGLLFLLERNHFQFKPLSEGE